MSSIFEQGVELLQQEPWPADIEAQLDALREKLHGSDRDEFDSLYEVLLMSETPDNSNRQPLNGPALK